MSERGSITVVVMAVAGLLASLTVGAAGVAMAYTAREQASTAAEAAALAAAVATYPGTGRPAPSSEARRAAAANGARLDSCRCPVDPSLSARTVTVRASVEVVVPIFGTIRVMGAARAEFDPLAWLGA